jgi:hypothetical protein
MRILKLCFALFLFLFAADSLQAQNDLNVIQGDNQWLHYTDAKNSLYHHFASEAYAHLEQRRKEIAGFSSLPEWNARKQWIKQTLLDIAGPFPAKSPLNARVVKTIVKDDYRIEHIIYESQPRFYVTSSLYIPKSLKKNSKAPAVIYCSGHSELGYRSGVYQHVIINLVKKGFVVFAFDPVGQGERLEYYDAQTGKSTAGGPTAEHSYPGTQAFISGSCQARYMIWDGIRAVDFLLTRKEVDPSRIGITGRSGGGTQSAYVAAFDERIKAAAPECYITNFTRLLESIGPQDAEQNFPQEISRGLDHGDLLIVRAPKPALMITTTRDMFSIQGARETAAEVSRVYKAFGKENLFAMVEDDAPHASTKKNREAMYAFFQTSLENPGASTDEEVTPPGPEELKVTATGQVSTSLGGETVFSLNSRETSNIAASENDRSASAVIDQAKKLSGYVKPHALSKAIFAGRIQRDGYSIEKYFVQGEGDYVIPFLLMIPGQPATKTVLYLHPGGKAAEASANGEMEALVRNGAYVLAPDLPGIGELGAGDFRGDAFIGGISHNLWYSALLVGRSIAGLHASDITRVLGSVDVLRNTDIYGVARSEMGPALLYAAAFDNSIKKVAMIEPLSSYEALVVNHDYRSNFVIGAVPGSLKAFDLPDLAATLMPRKLLFINPVNGMGEITDDNEIQDSFSIIRKAYSEKNNERQFQTLFETSEEKIRGLLIDWMTQE